MGSTRQLSMRAVLLRDYRARLAQELAEVDSLLDEFDACCKPRSHGRTFKVDAAEVVVVPQRQPATIGA